MTVSNAAGHTRARGDTPHEPPDTHVLDHRSVHPGNRDGLTDDHCVASVEGRAVTVAQLEARLDAIYRGPMAIRLPARHSDDGIRIRRWAAHLLASETLVLAEADRLGVIVPTAPPHVPTSAPVTSNGADPDTDRAVQRAVAGLFAIVTADVTVEEKELRRYYDANRDLWTREDMSTADHDAATAAQPVLYPEVRERIADDLLSAARGQVFDDWLSCRRAELVTLSPGYEHPGDPSVPDFVHRH